MTALLSVSDPSSTATGRLVNGAFSLAAPIQARAASAGGTGGALAAVGGSAAPTSLLTYNLPKSNDSRDAVVLAGRRSERGAPLGHLQQGADLHAVDYDAVRHSN